MPRMKFCPYCGAPLAAKTIEDRERLVCSQDGCPYVFWENPTPVVAALVEHNGEIVMARNKAWPEGMFGLITGFLEKGETPEQAVVREVKEELGLDAAGLDFIGVYAFELQNQLIVAYHVVCAPGNIVLGDELAELKIRPPEQVKPWGFGTGPAVRDWLERRGKTSF